MNSPFFSILIPIYNVENYLPKCLDSIIVQTFQDFEVILINDGSPDKSGALADDYAAKDPRFSVIHKDNGGSADARNVGLLSAKGEYVLFLDSDDYWNDKFALEKLYHSLHVNQSDVILFNCQDYDCIQQRIIAGRPDYDLNHFTGSKDLALLYLIKNDNFPGAAWILSVRKDFLIENNIQFVKGNKAEDIDWLIAVFYSAKSINAINERFYTYLKNRSGSITSQIDTKGVNGILHAINHWKVKLMSENNPMIGFLQYQYLILIMNLDKSGLFDRYKTELLIHKDLLNPAYSTSLKNSISSKIIRFFGFKIGSMILTELFKIHKYISLFK